MDFLDTVCPATLRGKKMITVRYDPNNDYGLPVSGLASMNAIQDCLVFRLSEIDQNSALRLVVRPRGISPHVEVTASASRAPGEHDWFNPLSPINNISNEMTCLLTGWQLIRLKLTKHGSEAYIMFAANRVTLTHNWLPNASLMSGSVKVKDNFSEEVELGFHADGGPPFWILDEHILIHHKDQLNHIGDRIMELADYTWQARSMNPSMVLASISEYTEKGLKIKLSRLHEGLVEVNITGTPHHGGNVVSATLKVS